MPPTTSSIPHDRRDPPVGGAHEWLALSDAILAGLVHALNNRLTALSVCAELAGAGDDQAASSGILTTELVRLQHACALLAQLPARGLMPEAVELVPVIRDAIALHSHHPRLRAVECEIEQTEALHPVRVPRWALLRLCLILVDVAKQTAGATGLPRATLRLSGDDGAVRVHARAAVDLGAYTAAMAEACGGEVQRDGEDLVLTLPSLHELRRRERGTRATA
jgi:hypothetical protein